MGNEVDFDLYFALCRIAFIVSLRNIPRQQFVEPVDWVVGNTGEDITQIGFRVDAV